MQTAVTVVNLIHDTATETDRPVCWVFAGCTAGYLPYAQWAALSAAEKAKHWTLKRGWKLVQGAVPALTEAEYAKLEKTHLCCTAAAVSDDREPLLPHWHVEGS